MSTEVPAAASALGADTKATAAEPASIAAATNAALTAGLNLIPFIESSCLLPEHLPTSAVSCLSVPAGVFGLRYRLADRGTSRAGAESPLFRRGHGGVERPTAGTGGAVSPGLGRP